MAGDRGLAFVVIGLIGISAFWISNQGHIERRPEHAQAAGIDSTIAVAPTPDLTNGDTDVTYILRRHDRRDLDSDRTAMLGMYPELSGAAGDALQRIRLRLRHSGDARSGLPLD